MPVARPWSPRSSLLRRQRRRGLGAIVAQSDAARALALIVAAVTWLFCAHAAVAQGVPSDLRYRLSWAGLPIADIRLEHSEVGDGYRAEVGIETIGVIDSLFRYRARVRATGERTPELMPVQYRNAYESSRKSRKVKVTYDPATGDVVDLKITKRGEPDRSKVPPALQKGVVDPVTTFLRLRAHFAAEERAFTAAIFDGRRRYDLRAERLGQDRARIAGRDWAVLRVGVTLTWIAGSNRDDTDVAEADSDTFRMEMLLSADERAIPLRLVTLGTTFAAMVELVPDCKQLGGCPPIAG